MKWVMIKRSKVKLRGQYCSFELLMRQMNKYQPVKDLSIIMANNLTLKNHVNERRREPIKAKFISKYIYEEFGSQIHDLEIVYATF